MFESFPSKKEVAKDGSHVEVHEGEKEGDMVVEGANVGLSDVGFTLSAALDFCVLIRNCEHHPNCGSNNKTC
jgi:poly-beta-hydroxyalkanoate depolymerase